MKKESFHDNTKVLKQFVDLLQVLTHNMNMLERNMKNQEASLRNQSVF
jgi:hypothetical protein